MAERKSQWYFGGLASAGAACCTHPLDLLKVQMQTQKGKNISFIQLTTRIVREQGLLVLYNGISASLLRQLTYSMTRFGVYETAKQNFISKDGSMPFHISALLAASGGAAGGFVGTPADLVNVRMQNDIKLAPNLRRNYRHAIHGLAQVMATEGVTALWSGASMAVGRAILMTVGQLTFYDQVKFMLLATPYFSDNVVTHVSASFVAGGVATALTQPLDVLKTRAMNAPPEDRKGIVSLLVNTAKEGPMSFYKGFIPAFIRLAPHTILTFVFLEQLRMNFGILPPIAITH